MKPLRILYLTAELAPLTGDGDLARENRFLARQLAEFGCQVTTVVPRRAIDDPATFGLARRLSPLDLPRSARPATLYEGTLSGGRVEVITVEPTSEADSPAPDQTLGQEPQPQGAAELDVYCESVLAVARRADRWPDVVIAGHGAERAFLQFMADAADASSGPVPATLFTLRRFAPDPELERALAASDRVVVSSSSWAESLRRNPASHPAGALVAPIIDRLRGVTSGIDSLEWNPHRDRHLLGDLLGDPQETKARHKAALQRELGLRQQADVPLFAVVGPLDIDLLPYTAANEMIQRDLQLVVLGDPDRDDRCLRGLERLAQGSSLHAAIRTTRGDENDRAFEHRLLAAADFALFARRFTPGTTCELYCAHYGAVPIAPRSGTFADVIVEFDSNTASGSGILYTLEQGNDAHLLSAVDRALRAYAKPSLAKLVERLLELDLSWHTAAQRYINVLLEALREKRQLAA